MGFFPPLLDSLPDVASDSAAPAGRVFRGDVRSADWDGGGDLSGGKDASATKGYLIDYSSGAAQFRSIFADGGELGSLTITGDLTLSGGSIEVADIRSDNWNGQVPLNIDDDGDSSASLGYGLDASTGQIQATRLFVAPGQLSSPAVSYITDATTGFFFFTAAEGPSGGDGAIGAVCSGGASWTLNNDGSGPGTFAVVGHIHAQGGALGRFKYSSLPNSQTATSAVLWWNGTAYEIVPTSSTVRGKRNIRDHPQLADIELKPKKYIHKASGNEEYGLTVEDLVQQDPKIGIWDDNVKRYDDYQDRAVIAILAAKVNRLKEQVETLEGAL